MTRKGVELPKRGGSSLTHPLVRVLKGSDERFDGGDPDLSERVDSTLAHARVIVREGGEKGRDRGGSDLNERPCGEAVWRGLAVV